MTALGRPRDLFDGIPLPPSAAGMRVVVARTADQSRIRARITLVDAKERVLETITLRVGVTGWALLAWPALQGLAKARDLHVHTCEAASFQEADSMAVPSTPKSAP